MWELIRANKRNSIVLMVIMAVVLLLLGFIIGLAFSSSSAGGLFGLMIASAIWLVLTLISFSSGDQILLAASKAKLVTHDVHPQLFNVVEEMKIAAGLPAMPKIYIINDPAPNAFATGRKPETASVAVTAGLLARLNRDELQGVIAHEISHILHRDILFVTLAGIMLGSIVLLSQVFLRGMFYSSMMGSRRRYSIANPFKKKKQRKLSDLTSTHPPISERVRILRNMTHGASFKDYSNAFAKVTHTKTVIPPAALTKEDIALREAEVKTKKEQRKETQMHQVGDIMRRVNQFVFLTCLCGLKLKIPPNFKSNKVTCPRCKRKLDLPPR